ncbi:hypothetical protein NLU13_9213 [Sarocladium strictum]|uniref:Uncharacterized protein n=1 Tax=Sarocladium strictum TaxID=5046 RepID=A0AA39L455_SARSR|nr:hypothetical protein NLU13_9213 [Sarocladium strictum]
MASLNLSINGASIKSSYSGVVNGPAPSSSSPTYAQWALFSVQAPLMSAFQDAGSKESVLKVQSTGDGELAELIEDFNEGRIQFAFVKVKDPNSGLPKNVLIAWCGGGVPERTKGYFTSHLNAVSKVLHGYHVQITARSDTDLDPESIMRKVADASGAKYSAGSSTGGSAAAPPPIKSKPVFTPSTSSGGRVFDPLVAARAKRDENVDEDGWGADAPPVTRSQVERVESAYKPTKVNMAELTSSKPEPSRFGGAAPHNDTPSDVVRGGYQPIGKVDIAAIRAQAKNQGDERPTPVKGSYEPVGKVDIAAIKARAQKPTASEREVPEEAQEAPKPVSDRAAAFTQPSTSERLTSLPKPKVAKKFGGASTFSGTKAPTPGGLGFGGPSVPAAPPVGSASRTFADSGGKTPAQLWAEKKARERGDSVGSASTPSAPAPVEPQQSGNQEWKSGYAGKSWAPVQTSGQFGRPAPGAVSQDNTGEPDVRSRGEEEEGSHSGGGIAALKDRFKDAAPISIGAAPSIPRPAEEPEHAEEPEADDHAPPPPPPESSRPTGGFQLPGLPSRPIPADEREDEPEDPSAYQPVEQDREQSPPRVAVPVSRGADPPLETPPEERAPPPMPVSAIPVPKEEDLPEPSPAEHTAREASEAVAQQTFEPEQVAAGQAQQGGGQGGHRAVVQFDYEKAEDNEIELIEGQLVINIEMVDEDWWMGTNHKGEVGYFPSNYVELVQGDEPAAHAAPTPAPAPAPAPAPVSAPAPAHAPAAASAGPTATALFDYEAAEDNELSFPEDAKITELEFPDEDWWFGAYNGKKGLFPSNYVQLNQ